MVFQSCKCTVLQSDSMILTARHRPTDGTGELRFPKFKHISQFTYIANGGSPEEVYSFLAQNKASLRSVHLHNQTWTFPSEVIAVRNLTHLDFFGAFSAESQGIGEILRSGIQLESLRLWCSLECHASTQFRDNLKGLPFLRHFAFILHGQCVNDNDLFPAISEFLRDRTHLHCLQLTVPNADWAQRRLGYDATVWGVLPSLTGLKSLHATLPKDVAAAVAMWLVPRSVTTLSLHGLTSSDPISFVTVRSISCYLSYTLNLTYCHTATTPWPPTWSSLHRPISLPRRRRHGSHPERLPQGMPSKSGQHVLHRQANPQRHSYRRMAQGQDALSFDRLAGVVRL